MTASPLHERSLEDLLEGYKEADQRSFDELFRRTQRAVFNLLLTKLGNRADAEDAFQETYFRVHRFISSYRRDKGGLAWLFTIARNVVFDRIKSRAESRTEQLEDFDALTPSAHEALAAKQILLKALSSLSSEERELIIARFVNDDEYETIAKAHGLSEVNTRQKISRLLRRFRESGSR